MDILCEKLSRVIPPSADIDKEIRTYLCADLPLPDDFDKKNTKSICQYWGADRMKEAFPGLQAVAMAALSIFHGPAVESSFSEMSNYMDKHKGQMEVHTYDASQKVRYYLRSQGKKATELYSLKNIKTNIDLPLCASIWQADTRRKNAALQTEKRMSYGAQKVLSAKRAAEIEKENIEKDKAKKAATQGGLRSISC